MAEDETRHSANEVETSLPLLEIGIFVIRSVNLIVASNSHVTL